VAGYRIDGVLGEGAMSTVYRATQLSLNRVVALKLLATELSSDPGFRTRFQREGERQAALDHPHIVTVYEAGQIDEYLFLAMSLVAGPTLKELIREGDLDPRRSVRLLAQVAQALDEAHRAGLIHRDIKPQNILVGPDDHAYLADFGLLKAIDDADPLTRTGQFIGTIDYVAPEQVQGDPASAASDSYALAAVLYECLTGQVPFPRANQAATLHAHVMAPPPRVSEVRPDLPEALDEVIAYGMAKDPAARPAESSELMREATRALATASPHLASAASSQGPAAPENERSQTTLVSFRPETPDSVPRSARSKAT
jgi:serine/threonine protein kinase